MNLVEYFDLIIAILMFIIGVIFVIQSIRNKRKAYSLTIAVFIGVIASLLKTIRPLFSGLARDYVLVAHLGTWCIMYLLALVFFSQLTSDRINPILFSLALILTIEHITFGLIWVREDLVSDTFHSHVDSIWSFLYSLIGFVVFMYGAYVHYKTYRTTEEIPGLIISIALIFLTIGFTIGMIKEFWSPGSLADIGEVLKILGILVFTIFYIVRINYIFRLPFKIDTIIIFNKLGMLVYAGKYVETDIETEDNEELPIDLITASLNAFQIFMAETTRSKQPLKKIVTGDRKLIIEEGKLCSAAIICSQTSYFLLQSLENLIEIIESKYAEKLKLDYTESKWFKGMDQVISQSFPYLGVPHTEKY